MCVSVYQCERCVCVFVSAYESVCACTHLRFSPVVAFERAGQCHEGKG